MCVTYISLNDEFFISGRVFAPKVRAGKNPTHKHIYIHIYVQTPPILPLYAPYFGKVVTF